MVTNEEKDSCRVPDERLAGVVGGYEAGSTDAEIFIVTLRRQFGRENQNPIADPEHDSAVPSSLIRS